MNGGPLSLLTTAVADGMNANMRAEVIRRAKTVFPDGSIVEMVIWKLPHPVAGSAHNYKYRLFFGRNGARLVGYDNERGKGDHRHLDGQEIPYAFTSVEKLVQDFLADVRKRMSE
jgi:hypothetical protein